MSRYNHAIGIAFEFLSDDPDPVSKKNLKELVQAARDRLDKILDEETLDAFDTYDTYEIN